MSIDTRILDCGGQYLTRNISFLLMSIGDHNTKLPLGELTQNNGKSLSRSKLNNLTNGDFNNTKKLKKVILPANDYLLQSFDVHIDNEYLLEIRNNHSFTNIEKLVKRDLSNIVKGLSQLDKSTASDLQSDIINKIFSVYNNTNDNKVKNIDDLLLTDFTYSNISYLHVLKILTLQYSVKTDLLTKQVSTLYSVLLMFAFPDRYLFQTNKEEKNASSFKITNIIKLLLFSYSSTKNLFLRFLFSLKFIELTLKYNLEFKSFIKHLTFDQFIDQIPKILLKFLKLNDQKNNTINGDRIFSLIIPFFQNFKKTLMIYSKTNNNSTSSIKNCLKQLYPLIYNNNNTQLMKYIISTKEMEKNLIHNDIFNSPFNINNLLILQKIWNKLSKNLLLFNDSKKFDSIQYQWQFLDNTLIYLNSNISKLIKLDENKKSLNTPQNLSIILEILRNILNFSINNNSLKRLPNLISVSFNCFCIFKDNTFLDFAIDIQLKKLTLYSMKNSDQFLSSNDENIKQTISNCKKFISSSSNDNQKWYIFNKFFNFFTIYKFQSLSSIINFLQILSVNCFSLLSLSNDNIKLIFSSFTTSNFMVAILLASTKPIYSNKLINFFLENWSTDIRILFKYLSNNNNDNKLIEIPIDINSLNHNKGNFLYKYYPLLKIVYSLDNEMKNQSILNLQKITNKFIDSWFNLTKIDNFQNETITNIETNLIKILLQYLTFNNFHKTALFLITNLENENYQSNYFIDLKNYINYYKLKCFTELQLTDKTDQLKNSIFNNSLDSLFSNNTHLNDSLILSYTILSFIQWSNDHTKFQEIFIDRLPNLKPHLFQLQNTNNLSSTDYIHILLFNISLFSSSSSIQLSKNNIPEAIIEANRSLKIAIGLLKYKDKLQESSRLILLSSLITSYVTILNAYIHIGSGKDSEVIINEFSKLISTLHDPTPVFNSLTVFYNFYKLIEDESMQQVALKKIDKTFEYIDSDNNINAVCLYMSINDKQEQIPIILHDYFEESINDTFLTHFWTIKNGKPIDDQLCLEKFKNMNNINKINEIYIRITKTLSMDPFFRNMFDSILVTPSCIRSANGQTSKKITDGYISITSSANTDSPRSSNMTPRGKKRHQEFDKASILNDVKRMKALIESLDINQLTNLQLKEISSLYSLCVSLFSNIETIPVTNETQVKQISLSDLNRCMPLHYDKILSSIDKNVYENISLLNILNEGQYVSECLKDCNNFLKKNSTSKEFQIISLDICPKTGHLLISKSYSFNNKTVHARISFDRASSRDLDKEILSFDDARNELREIILQSNVTTSLSITSMIKTKEDRKYWWETRHDLDRKLYSLLMNIENTWLSGIKGLFDETIVDPVAFEEFKSYFYNILLQNLPTRKNFGMHSNLLLIDDWILELFLKLDPSEPDFYNSMEDLIYFVLDILLYHGEENAYDEIDMNILHVSIEDHIRSYHSKIDTVKRLEHTFLVVSSVCHSIPWESLPVLKTKSVTRAPSIFTLSQLLENYNSSYSLNLSENLAMILNPHCDLMGTESRFIDTLSHLSVTLPNSELLTRIKPTKDVFLKMLSSSNAFIYIGHGGGEQFVCAKDIKRLNSVAPSFLFGCSSATMKYYGKLEPTGIIYAYLLGQSPLVLGNLWDVTDKDIDRLTQRMFELIGLVPNPENDTSIEMTSNLSVPEALVESRHQCHLKYLNGSAPVLYGLPLSFL